MVNIPFQDVGTRIQTFRYQVRDHIETVGGWDIWTFEDISTEISFKELDAGAKLTRKPEDGKAVWTLERNVVWREDGVNYKKTEEGQLIISSDGERTYTMNGAEAAEEDRKVLDSFVKVAEKYQAPIGFRDVLSGVLFGLGVLLVFHAVYGAVQVRVGWIYHVTPLRPLYRRIPVIVYAINMERLSKVQRDFISLYGRGTWLDKDLPPK